MRWTRYPSHSAAVRALDSAMGGDGGLRRGMIERLVNGGKPHHNGFEARRCDDHGEGDGGGGGGGSAADDDGASIDGAPPSCFRQEQHGILDFPNHTRSDAVEVRAPKHATERLRGKVGTHPSAFSRN